MLYVRHVLKYHCRKIISRKHSEHQQDFKNLKTEVLVTQSDAPHCFIKRLMQKFIY